MSKAPHTITGGTLVHSAPKQPSGALMPTYARENLVFDHGKGAWLYTANGDKYLDFTSGIAVTALGHAHPHLVQAIQDQAAKLLHTSNLFRIEPQERLGERLCALTFAETVFFCNSGTEAVEGSIKTARRYHYANGAPERTRIVTFEGAFHGRTLAALAAGASDKYREGFAPVVEGFDRVPLNDLDALEGALGDETAAVLIEPLQGEGGVNEVTIKNLRAIRKLCEENAVLLILDEVQSGMGRTGHLFAHQAAGIEPDILAAAKGLGGGFPIGAVLATKKAASGMVAGTHGSTFGGNPLAMAAGNAVLDIVEDPQFLETVRARGLRLCQALAELQDTFPGLVQEIRGQGLLLGLKLTCPPGELVNAARDNNLLLVGASDNVVRILPPLNIGEDEMLEGVARLKSGLQTVAGASSQKKPAVPVSSDSKS